MSNPTWHGNRATQREWLRRVDRYAADLNVVLLLFAIGLATLDVTFVISRRVIDRLPPMHVAVSTDDGRAPITVSSTYRSR